MWLFPAMPGGRVLPMMAYTGRLRPKSWRGTKQIFVRWDSAQRSNPLAVEKAFYICDWCTWWQCGFPAVKRATKFYARYVKVVQLANRRYMKSWKMVYKRLRGGPPPYKNLFTLSHELMNRVWPVRRSFLTESIVVLVSIREIAYTVSQETIHGFQQIRCRGANSHHYCEGNE